MNIGVYQSAASLTALERWQDVTAQNVTASQVTGYRKRTVEFSGIPMGDIQGDPEKGRSRSSDTPRPLFPKASTAISFNHGENFPTQRPLAFAIEGNGFFELRRPDGSLTYTREGMFHISPERKLVSRDGFELMSKDGNAIQFIPGAGDLTIVENGLLMQGATQIGRLGLKTVENTADFMPVAAGAFDLIEGAEAVEVDPKDFAIIQGHLEGSNVTPMQEMIALVQIARAYEANQKSMTTQDQILGRAIETLG